MPISIIVRLRHGRYEAGGDRPAMPNGPRIRPVSSARWPRPRRGIGLGRRCAGWRHSRAGDLG